MLRYLKFVHCCRHPRAVLARPNDAFVLHSTDSITRLVAGNDAHANVDTSLRNLGWAPARKCRVAGISVTCALVVR